MPASISKTQRSRAARKAAPGIRRIAKRFQYMMENRKRPSTTSNPGQRARANALGNYVKSEPEDSLTDLTRASPWPNQGTQYRTTYIIDVSIIGTNDPPVKRTLVLPADLTFDKVHKALQIAFSWDGHGWHKFEIRHSTEHHVPVLTLLGEQSSEGKESLKVRCESKWTLAEVYEHKKWNGVPRLRYIYNTKGCRPWVHELKFLVKGYGQPTILGGSGRPCAELTFSPDGWPMEKDQRQMKHLPRPDRESMLSRRLDQHGQIHVQTDPRATGRYNCSEFDSRNLGFVGIKDQFERLFV